MEEVHWRVGRSQREPSVNSPETGARLNPRRRPSRRIKDILEPTYSFVEVVDDRVEIIDSVIMGTTSPMTFLSPFIRHISTIGPGQYQSYISYNLRKRELKHFE